MKYGQLEAFLLTLAIEVPVLVALAFALRWVPGRRVRLALAGLLASGVTHPILWGIWDEVLLDWAYGWKVLVLEAGVVLVEAVVLSVLGSLGWWRGFAASVVANAISTAIGLVVQ